MVKFETGCPFCKSANTVREEKCGDTIIVSDLHGMELSCMWCHRKFTLKIEIKSEEPLPTDMPKKGEPLKYSLF